MFEKTTESGERYKLMYRIPDLAFKIMSVSDSGHYDMNCLQESSRRTIYRFLEVINSGLFNIPEKDAAVKELTHYLSKYSYSEPDVGFYHDINGYCIVIYYYLGIE
jgi:hypothetical protein